MLEVKKKYSTALANYTRAAEMLVSNEERFLDSKNYVNDDGTVPVRLKDVRKNHDRKRLTEEFEKSEMNTVTMLDRAGKELTKAEDELIDFGIAHYPEDQQKLLQQVRKSKVCRSMLIQDALSKPALKAK